MAGTASTNSAPRASLPGLPGFKNPVFDTQRIFRRLMRTMSLPGTVVTIAGIDLPAFEGVMPASAATLMALADRETAVWIDGDLCPSGISDYLRFHTGAPAAKQRQEAVFALIDGRSGASAFDGFNPGTDEYPDRSATVIVQVEGFGTGQAKIIDGPGIKEPREISVQGLVAGFWSRWTANQGKYPRGVDLFLVSGEDVLGLPRSVREASKEPT